MSPVIWREDFEMLKEYGLAYAIAAMLGVALGIAMVLLIVIFGPGGS